MYIVNERLTEMVENAHILSQAQGGFRQNKSTDINGCKLYGLTNEAQRLKKLFLRVDIDFKSAFNRRPLGPFLRHTTSQTSNYSSPSTSTLRSD